MTIALVSAGSVASGSTSASPSFGQSTTSGNLLLAWVSLNDSASSFPLSPPSGWGEAEVTGVSYNYGALFYKNNCGSGETAPSFSDSNATEMHAGLAEFSGIAVPSLGGPVDQHGHAISANPCSASAGDTASGDLVVGLSVWNGSNSGPTLGGTISDYTGNPLTTHVIHDNSGAGPGLFYHFTYAVTTGHAPQNGDTLTASIDVFENSVSSLIVSFLAA